MSKVKDKHFKIIKLVSKIRTVWLHHPTLSFGKMITCLFSDAGKGKEPFDVTDEELNFALNKELKRNEND